MKKIHTLLALCFCWIGHVQAQNIYVHTQDQQTHVYQLIDVNSITFNGNVMNLNLITEDTISWNFSQIRYYNYDQWYVSVPEGLVVGEEGLKIFPNPTQEQFTIEYELTAKSDVEVSLIDMQGRLVKQISVASVTPGLHQIKLNATNLNLTPGTFIVRLVAGKSMFNKILLIHE